MANFSDLTRKEQVHARLKAQGGWVDGSDLATEECGGSEGLRRLRELVEDDGLNVRKRRHPDPARDIWQYRLVPPSLDIPIDDEPERPPDRYDVVAASEGRDPWIPAPESAEPPVYPKPEPVPQTRMSSAVHRKEDGTFEYVPPQRPIEQMKALPEPKEEPGEQFSSLPAKIDFGEVAVCPRCKAKTTRGPAKKREVDPETAAKREHQQRRKKMNAAIAPTMVDDAGTPLHRDPVIKKFVPCLRCGGYGIVPNIGPIALSLP
jgi:hypothetical protein